MEYVSQKTVNILERRLGLMHLFFLTIIAGYMLGVRLIVERGYTAVEISHGFVSARLEGKTYSMGGGQAYAVDAPELIASQLDGKLAIVLRSLWPEALYWLMERKARKLLRGAG